MLNQCFLAAVFLAGIIFQSLIIALQSKKWKGLKYTFFISLLMFAWFLAIGIFSGDNFFLMLKLTIIFSGFIWTLIFSIYYIKNWFSNFNLVVFAVHIVVFIYIFKLGHDFHDFLKYSLIAVSIAFAFRYLIVPHFNGLMVFLCAINTAILAYLAVKQTAFLEFYQLIDPMKNIDLSVQELFLGGMMFFYVGANFAIIFMFWSFMWGYLGSVFQKEKFNTNFYQNKEYKGFVKSFLGVKIDKNPINLLEAVFLIIAFVFLSANYYYKFASASQIIFIGIVIIPQLFLFENKIKNFFKK